MKRTDGAVRHTTAWTAGPLPETTVLVAVGSPNVREALVAMLGTLEGFRVVAEAATDEDAVEAARAQRPRLALVEAELSEYGGWWAMQQIQTQRLAGSVVALGRRADGVTARIVGAQAYVQIGTSPGDLLCALRAALALGPGGVSGAAQAENHLLADAHAVVGEPALVDL